ncbi:MAG: hypothetical protein ASUL_04351, partial [Candidatus Aramenus sulfurataquae]
ALDPWPLDYPANIIIGAKWLKIFTSWKFPFLVLLSFRLPTEQNHSLNKVISLLLNYLSSFDP